MFVYCARSRRSVNLAANDDRINRTLDLLITQPVPVKWFLCWFTKKGGVLGYLAEVRNYFTSDLNFIIMSMTGTNKDLKCIFLKQ